MQAAIIYDDRVDNVVEAQSLTSARSFFPDAEVLNAATIGGGIGWTRVDGSWQAPVPVAPLVPSEITDRQFFQAIATSPWSLITQAEALAAVQTGAIPAAMQAFIDALPAEAQFEAAMLISGAQTFVRDNPLVAAFGAAQGMSPAQVDALWVFAKSL